MSERESRLKRLSNKLGQSEEELATEAKAWNDREGPDYNKMTVNFISLALIKPSEENMDYIVNMSDHSLAQEILKQLLEINPELLKTNDSLAAAMVHSEDSSFAPVLKKYRSNPGAVELLRLAGSIKQDGLLEPVVLRPGEQIRGIDNYVLIAGMRRFLAHQLLNEEYINANIIEKAEDEDKRLSIVENMQRKMTTAEKYGQAIADLKTQKPWLSQAEIGAALGGIPQRSISRYEEAWEKLVIETTTSKEEKPKLTKQIVIAIDGGKLVWTGKSPISSEKVAAIQKIIIE